MEKEQPKPISLSEHAAAELATVIEYAERTGKRCTELGANHLKVNGYHFYPSSGTFHADCCPREPRVGAAAFMEFLDANHDHRLEEIVQAIKAKALKPKRKPRRF